MDWLREAFAATGRAGPFALGTVWGVLISYGAHYMASGERKQRVKLEVEREKNLLEQLKLKDDRIDKLHELLKQTKEKGKK